MRASLDRGGSPLDKVSLEEEEDDDDAAFVDGK